MDKSIKGKIKSICEKIRLRRKLKTMESLWNFYVGSCFGLFPPSFYHKHSEKEIQRLQREEIARLKEILNDYIKRNESQA